MRPDTTQGLRRPLFFKLGLIFLVASVTVVSSVGAFFYFQRPHGHRQHESFRRNTIFYVNTLIDRIGDPPQAARASKLSEELALQLRIEGPGIQWASAENVPRLEEFEEGEGPDDIPGIRMGHVGGFGCSLASKGPYRYLFLFPGRPMFQPPLHKILIQLGLISAVLILSFAAVQWLLKPMKMLGAGVEEIRSGNLDYQITLPQGHREFEDLADAFNGMTSKVRSMISAKDRLLVDVSHELRSPLSRIKLALAMMPKSAKAKSIARAASEMETMLSEILESERLKSSHGALHKSAVSLPALASSVALNLRGLKPGIKVAKPGNFPRVPADEAKAMMVIKNVVENSLKYSGDQKKAVEIAFEDSEKNARVLIRDFGSGIPQEELALVFEPFYRVDKSRAKKTGGYGLGLSLCREIMKAHGGEISIESAPGAGTLVSLSFPKN